MLDFTGIHISFPLRIRKGTALSITIHLSIPRREVPGFCEAFCDVISDVGLCSAYEPHYMADKCLCNYAWHIRHGGQEHGLLVVVWVPIGNEGIADLRVFVSAGQGLEAEDEIILEASDFDRLKHSIEAILDRVQLLRQGHCETWHVCWFLEGICLVTRSVREGPLSIFPSCRVDGKTITPFVVLFKAVNRSLARSRSSRYILLVRSILEVLSQNSWTFHRPEQANGDECTFAVEPDQDRVYSLLVHHESVTDDERRLSFHADEYVQAGMRLAISGHLDADPLLLNSLLAFADAMDVERKHPVLACIAYFASLSSMATDQSCDGEVSCSKCGELRGFRHKRWGEAILVTKFLEGSIFKGRDWPAEDVRKCLQDFHRNMRSAFVHQARPVLDRGREEQYSGPLWPSEESLLHEETHHVEVLYNVKTLASLAILYHLSKYDDVFSAKLQAEIADFKLLQFSTCARFRVGPISVRLGIPRPAEFTGGGGAEQASPTDKPIAGNASE